MSGTKAPALPVRSERPNKARRWAWLLLVLLNLVTTGCGITDDRAQLFATVSSSRVAPTSPTEIPSSPAPGGVTPAAAGEATPGPASTAAVMGETVAGARAADERAGRLHSYLVALSEQNQFWGTVLVAQDSEILLNEGYGPADVASGRANGPNTQYRIGSLTKQFTAAAIMRLQELGRLDVNDPLSLYLPEYPNSGAISLHQLLTHTSGVANYTRRPDLEQIVQTPIALDDLIAEIAAVPPDFAPGERFAYSDSGYVLLTKVIEVASGQPYADFLQQQFFDPLDMASSGYDFLAPGVIEPATGYQLTPAGPRPAVKTDASWPSGAGALYSNAADLYRWDRALGGREILDATSEEAIFTPWVDSGQGFSYGYGWEIGQMAGRASQMHAGTIFGFASFIARFPQEEATIILLSNGLQQSPREISSELARILFESTS
ncbi:MAG: serine hydrolase domain-containing protein [Candidatus Promineifilaceae bacterium]